LHALSTTESPQDISFVTFGSGVTSVDLIHCADGSALDSAVLTINGDTELCLLEGDDNGNPRWNDSVCSIVIH
jgi:hypothetical protein